MAIRPRELSPGPPIARDCAGGLAQEESLNPSAT
jgi:hypothetical protein